MGVNYSTITKHGRKLLDNYNGMLRHGRKLLDNYTGMLSHGRTLHDNYTGMLRHGRKLLGNYNGMLRHGRKLFDNYNGMVRHGRKLLRVPGRNPKSTKIKVDKRSFFQQSSIRKLSGKTVKRDQLSSRRCLAFPIFLLCLVWAHGGENYNTHVSRRA